MFCQAIEYFVKLLHDLDIICSYSLDPSLEGVLQFVVQFQKSQPDLVARAHLQVDFYCIYFYELINFTASLNSLLHPHVLELAPSLHF